MNADSKNINLSFILLSAFFIVFAGFSVFAEKYFLLAIPFGCLLFYTGWQNFSLLFFVLVVSLPFSIEYQVSESLGTDLPDELLMLVVSFLFFMNWYYRRDFLAGHTLSHPLLIVLMISLAWAIFTSLFSTQPVLSLKFLLAKSWYIAAFIGSALVVFSCERNIRAVAAGLIVSLFIVTAITLARHSQTSYSFATINAALQPFFRNHVNYAAMLVCIFPILFAYNRFDSRKAVKVPAGIALVIVSAALFLSYSRGAWLALLVGMLSWWLIKKRWLLKVYTGSVIFITITFAWLANNNRYLHFAHEYQTTIYHQDFREHMVATYEFKDMSTAERFYRWIAGVRMIEDRWLTGFGPNSFYHEYKPYTVTAYKTWVSDNEEHSTVHNYFLLLAIEQGIPALLIFLVLAGMLVYYAQSIYHQSNDLFFRRVAIVTGTIVMMLLTVNSLSDLIETDKVGSIFFLCMAVLVVADAKTRNSVRGQL